MVYNANDKSRFFYGFSAGVICLFSVQMLNNQYIPKLNTILLDWYYVYAYICPIAMKL